MMRRALAVVTVLLLVAGGMGLRAVQSGGEGGSQEAAEALVDEWIEALGGMETYWKLRTARFTLTTEMYDTESGRLRRTRPRYVTIEKAETGERARIERWEGNDFIQQGSDENGTWAFLNGEPLPDTAKDMREVAYVSGDVNYWIGLPFKLRDPGVNLAYRGIDEAGRHDVLVTFGEGVGDHQDTWHYYFVDGRVWPVEVTYQEAGKTNVNRTRWEDIREVDGFTYVGRRVHVDEDGRVEKVIRTSDLVVNPELEPGTFSPPPARGTSAI